MQSDVLQSCLRSPEAAGPLLAGWQLRDAERGWRNLKHLASSLGPDRLAALCGGLTRLLPHCPDPDMALNGLERFLASPAGAAQLETLLEGRARTLEVLLQLFSTSHYFSDMLALYPDCLEMLRLPLRHSPGRAEMLAELRAELEGAPEDAVVLRAFRRFRHRHLLRIGVNDIIRERPLEEITRDIATVAEVALEAALEAALRTLGRRFGEPLTAEGRPCACVVLALGKLGGEELNYSSDIDLMVVYEDEGATRGGPGGSLGNDDFFARAVSELVRLLSARTDRGQAYRIDLRLRPEGQRGALTRSLASTLAYYDSLGRTWERQALIKVRPVAGSPPLGQRFLKAIEPFVYRKYLGFAEINEIKALKRQIEQKASQAGVSRREVKTGRGGIRDIEFTIQLLQLLNGGDLEEVRPCNTLAALHALEKAGCLTDPEYRVLEDSYRFLRRVEHRLQILFDLQTHQLPASEEELRKLALRMGYPASQDPLQAFRRDYEEKTELTRRILDHLLHQTFAGDPEKAEPESDLILVPDPDPDTIRTVLGRYPFKDVERAYRNLTQLAQETVPFLSTRRCRHFLASIAPDLLRVVAETPDPDMALTNLEKVSASLGCKSVLWELFSFSPPSLRLYVDLCAWSQFLSEILINNPGMIDELLDSLVLNQPRSAEELRQELAELCRGAQDLELILHSFQDKELLRIGVRDILGMDTIQQTTAALSDLAETILAQIGLAQWPGLTARFGIPHLDEGGGEGRPCHFALLALGKLGGREMTYHSDLDLLLVYEGDGRTVPLPTATRFERGEATDNQHFFTEYAQRIIKAASAMGPMGRLYAVDMRLRPHGRSASLVLPLCELRRYHLGDPGGQEPCEGGAGLWERQILTRARLVHGDAAFGRRVMATLEEAVHGRAWRAEWVDEMLAMRQRLEASRKDLSLKRGAGGMADVEFLVQMFQIKYGSRYPRLCRPNTWEALDALREAGLLTPAQHETLGQGYDFLLRVQSRLRIVHNLSLDEVPTAMEEVDKLARRLGFESGSRLLAELEQRTGEVRQLFRELMARERGGPLPETP